MSLLKSLLKELGRRTTSASTESFETLLLKLAEQLKHNNAAQRTTGLAALRNLLQVHPESADAHALLGDAMLAEQSTAQAEASYRQALSLQPEHARAQEGLGLVLLGTRQLEQASLHFATAHRVDPMNAEILVHWGLVDIELGNFQDAGSRFQRAIERDARNANAWQNLGLVSYRLGHFAESAKQLRQAVTLNPNHGLAFSNLALALRQLNDIDAALEAALRASRLKPNSARVWVVLGDLYCDQGDFSLAAQSLGKAQQIDPQSAAAHIGRGKLHQAIGEHDQAKRSFEAALAIEPNNADARGGLGQLHLLLGEWAAGWDAYEARRLTQPPPVRRVPGREWRGEPLEGKSLLIHAEQGLGDIILFSSCLQDLIQQGAHCILDVPLRLERLFRRSFPNVEVLGHELSLPEETWLAGLPPFDFHLPIGSLPRWARRDTNSFPDRLSFLRADGESIHHWRQRLSGRQRPLIGLSWRGGLLSTAGQQRCIELHQLLEALQGIEASFVCLQYGDVADDLRAVNVPMEQVNPGLSGYSDLDDLASLTAALDGVITVCSTQAHLCGALGIPTAVLVPSNPSWRYGAQDSSMPWYPSLTLLRQTHPGDWSRSLEATRHWLSGLTAPTQ